MASLTGIGGAVLQIALWEEYSCKLEAQVHALTSENDALQKRIATVQSSLGAMSSQTHAECQTLRFRSTLVRNVD